MARPRTPIEKLKATGGTVAQPKRYKDRHKAPASKDLGKPSSFLKGKELVAWEAIIREAPWLKECDRTFLEIACVCRARLWTRKADGKDLDRLMRALSKLGMSPVEFASPGVV